MKTYLEIKVPLRYDAIWFEELRRAFQQIEVKWQTGFFHCIFNINFYICTR